MPTGLGDEKLWLCPSLDDSPDDLSGNGNNGTYVNGTSTVADSDPTYGGSRAYDFDGTDDGIRIYDNGVDGGGGPADFMGDGTFSVSVWVKIRDINTGAKAGPMWGTRQRGGYYGYAGGMLPLSNNGTWRYYFSMQENYINDQDTYLPSPAQDTDWHHLCWASTGGTAKLYVDGVFVTDIGNGTVPTLQEMTSLYFGAGRNWHYLDGLMDDIRFYERAITQAEITRLATSRGILGGLGGTHVHRTLLGVG